MSSADQPETVRVYCEGAVGWVWLNRPERRNAISNAMRQQLTTHLTALNDDDDVRVLVLTGTGTAFCSGVDLSEGPVESTHVQALNAKPLAALLALFDKPIVAAINGSAIGGGLELALAADLRIASTTATFGLPEVKIGSLPGSGGTQLARLMSPAVARRAIFTGEPFDAAEALRSGLVSDVAEPDDLIAVAQRMADSIACNAPLSLRAAKIALASTGAPSDALMLERALWGLLSGTADRGEGRTAFREHRPPHFTGS